MWLFACATVRETHFSRHILNPSSWIRTCRISNIGFDFFNCVCLKKTITNIRNSTSPNWWATKEDIRQATPKFGSENSFVVIIIKRTTLESGINNLLIFGIFSRGYSLITDLKDLKEYFPNLLETALLHQIFSNCGYLPIF